MDKKRAKITDENVRESLALKKIWDSRPHVSQEEFGAKYDIGTQGVVSHFLNGRTALHIKAAMAFAAELRCDVKDFSPRLASEIALFGVAAPRITDEDDLSRESLSQAAMAFGEKLFDPEPGYIAFDLLDVRAAAGNGCSAVEFPEVVKKIHVLESWAKANLPVDLVNIKVISARGTSMQGSIENGDVLFVDASVTAYDGDGIYVIARGGDVQVKRLQRLNGDVLAVISDNRAFETERLVGDEANGVIICGRVLAAWTIKRFW